MSATSQALATPELLEMILLNFPARDLLLSQRVCRTWRQATKASIKAQRALFRRSQPVAKLPEGLSPPPPTANPFLPRLYRWDIELDYEQLRALKKKGAMRMFVCQPPVRRVEVHGRLEDSRGALQERVVVREKGVKVKHVVMLLRGMPTRGWLRIVSSKEWQKV